MSKTSVIYNLYIWENIHSASKPGKIQNYKDKIYHFHTGFKDPDKL